MIDTLRLRIPISVSSPLKQEITIQRIHTETGLVLKTLDNSEKYKLTSSDLNLNIYKLTDYYVEIEFSLPKLLLYSNTFNLSLPQEARALLFLKEILETFFEEKLETKVEIFDIYYWLVQRADFAFSYKFESERDMENYLEQLHVFFKSAFMRKKNNVKLYQNEGAYFPSRYYTFKVYAKLKEFLRNDYSKMLKRGIPKEVVDAIAETNKGVLRFELELRKDALFDNIKKFRGSNPKVSIRNFRRCEKYGYKNTQRIIEVHNILDQDFQKFVFEKYLSSFCLKFSTVSTLSEKEIRDLLIKNYGVSDGVILYDFYLLVKTQGTEKMKSIYSQIRKGIRERSELKDEGIPTESTFYNRMKKLKAIDVSFYEAPKSTKYKDFDLFKFSDPLFPYSTNNTNKKEYEYLIEQARDMKLREYKKDLVHEIPYVNLKGI